MITCTLWLSLILPGISVTYTHRPVKANRQMISKHYQGWISTNGTVFQTKKSYYKVGINNFTLLCKIRSYSKFKIYFHNVSKAFLSWRYTVIFKTAAPQPFSLLIAKCKYCMLKVFSTVINLFFKTSSYILYEHLIHLFPLNLITGFILKQKLNFVSKI